MPFGFTVSNEYYAPQKYVHIRNPRHPYKRYFDYGIIALPRPFPRINKFMVVRSLPDKALKKMTGSDLICIAGYPGDRPTGTLWRHTEFLKRFTPRRILYSVDTCPGHSGSPVWYRHRQTGKRSIIGVHTSGIVDEIGRSYGCKKGSVLAPAGMMNSGVRITPDVLANIRNPRRKINGIRQMIRLPR
jgi:V8-like Glu-specific endopeptidase